MGAIVCKLDMHKKMFRRGYIAMLAVDSKHRRKSIGKLSLSDRLTGEALFKTSKYNVFLFGLERTAGSVIGIDYSVKVS